MRSLRRLFCTSPIARSYSSVASSVAPAIEAISKPPHSSTPLVKHLRDVIEVRVHLISSSHDLTLTQQNRCEAHFQSAHSCAPASSTPPAATTCPATSSEPKATSQLLQKCPNCLVNSSPSGSSPTSNQPPPGKKSGCWNLGLEEGLSCRTFYGR